MNFLRFSWWCTPLISFSWVRARDLSGQSKHKACLKKLSRIKWMRGPDISPMGQWTAEFHILEGHSYYQLGQTDKAQERLQHAAKILHKESNYTDWEKNYLRAYISECHPKLELGVDTPIDLENVDLDYVTNDMKNCFPLLTHPDWIH